MTEGKAVNDCTEKRRTGGRSSWSLLGVGLALASCSGSEAGGNGPSIAGAAPAAAGADLGMSTATNPDTVDPTDPNPVTMASGGAPGQQGMPTPSPSTPLELCDMPAPTVNAAAAEAVAGTAGSSDGVMSWTPTTTPNGLEPFQSWYSVGSTPRGDVYLSTADHLTNSALYKLDVSNDTLTYLGDARAASEAVDNWLPGESAEKFHTRPTYFDGRVYVATTDYSNADAGYLDRRGFHWYTYDEGQGALLDLSVNEPNGVAVDHFQCMTLVADRPRNLLYCLGTPNGHLYRYDLNAPGTVDLGRPDSVSDEYLFIGRFMWVDEAGVLYFTYQNHDFVYSYDPASSSFTAHTDWTLAPGLEIKFGQWSPDGRRCYMGDYEGRLYLFDDDDDSFTPIGQVMVPPEYYTTEVYLWMTRLFELSADEKKVYVMNEWSTGAYALFEHDIAANTTTKVVELSELDPNLPGPYLFHSGYDSWDNQGRFVYNNFNMDGDHLQTTRLDPVRIKVAQGLLPELVTVSVSQMDGALTVSRTGSTDQALAVLVAVDGPDPDAMTHQILNVEIPAGAPSLDISAQVRDFVGESAAEGRWIRVLANGDTYVAIASEMIGLGAACN